jgi:hypothetical protein
VASGSEFGCARLPVPGQKLVKVLDDVIGDAGEHIGEPSLWIDVVEFRRHDQRGHDGGAVGATLRRSLIIPGVWGKKLRSHIRTIHCSGSLRSLLPISFTTAAGI